MQVEAALSSTIMSHSDVELVSPFGRIRLAPPTPQEDVAVSILRSDPISRKYLRFMPEQISVAEVAARRESRAKDPRILDLYAYMVNEDGSSRFVGLSGVFNIDEVNGSCEAGILVSPELHGKGTATEILYTLLKYVFEERKFHRTTFETGVDNVNMGGWLQNVAGVRLEAERKECWKEGDGKYTDVHSYAILEWEWADRIKARLEERIRARASS